MAESNRWDDLGRDAAGNRVRARKIAASSSAPTESTDAPTASGSTPRTHAEADAQAAERGLVFPEDVTTVKAKIAYLASN